MFTVFTHRRLFAIPCSSVAVFLVAMALNPDTTEGQQRHAEVALSLQYPKRIQIPDEIPSVDFVKASGSRIGHKERRQLVFPVAIYSMTHYDGWQDCILRFQEGKLSFDEDDWMVPGEAVREPYSQRGHKDGFYDCKRVLRKMLSEMDRENVMSNAHDVYLPRSAMNEEDPFGDTQNPRK